MRDDRDGAVLPAREGGTGDTRKEQQEHVVSEARGAPRSDLDSAIEASMHYQIRVLRMFFHVFADRRTNNVYLDMVLAGVLQSSFRQRKG